jgi:hypothetical protein
MSLNTNNRVDFTFLSNLVELLQILEVWNLIELFKLIEWGKGKSYCAQGPLLARTNWHSSLAQPNGPSSTQVAGPSTTKQGSHGIGVG